MWLHLIFPISHFVEFRIVNLKEWPKCQREQEGKCWEGVMIREGYLCSKRSCAAHARFCYLWLRNCAFSLREGLKQEQITLEKSARFKLDPGPQHAPTYLLAPWGHGAEKIDLTNFLAMLYHFLKTRRRSRKMRRRGRRRIRRRRRRRRGGFQWFLMVVHNWWNDAMVTHHRFSLLHTVRNGACAQVIVTLTKFNRSSAS